MEVKLWTIILGAKTVALPWTCVFSVLRDEREFRLGDVAMTV